MVVARRKIGAAATIRVASAKGFAELVERHNGVSGGGSCMSFHPEGVGRDKSPQQNRAEKQRRVREGRPTPLSSSTESRAWAGASSARPTRRGKNRWVVTMTVPPPR
jgi:hypothetical protein